MSGFGSQSERRDGFTRRASQVAVLSVLVLLQACSSSEVPPTAQAGGAPASGPGNETWRQSSTFEADGPPGGGVYRGGRDPITGKAQEWSSGRPVETSSLPTQPIGPSARGGGPPPVVQAPTSPGTGLQGLAIVRPGDTLQSIAAAHGVPVATIVQANHLKNRNIKVGQRLIIPQ